MNKKILLLNILVMLFITSIVYNIYKSSRNELENSYKNYIVFFKKAKKYEYLKNKYNLNALKYINKFCSKKDSYNTIKLSCKTSPNNLRQFSLFLKSLK